MVTPSLTSPLPPSLYTLPSPCPLSSLLSPCPLSSLSSPFPLSSLFSPFLPLPPPLSLTTPPSHTSVNSSLYPLTNIFFWRPRLFICVLSLFVCFFVGHPQLEFSGLFTPCLLFFRCYCVSLFASSSPLRLSASSAVISSESSVFSVVAAPRSP